MIQFPVVLWGGYQHALKIQLLAEAQVNHCKVYYPMQRWKLDK